MFNRYKVLIAFLIGLTALAWPFFKEQLSPLLVVFLGLCLGLYFVMSQTKGERQDRDFLITVFSVGFLFRVTIASIIYLASRLIKGAGLFGDGWCYSENGNLILQMWLNGVRNFGAIKKAMLTLSQSGTLGAYDFWNAFIYYFTGKSPLSLLVINSFFGVFTAVFVYYITRHFANRRCAVFASLLTVSWPSLLFWSVQNLKDPIVIFFITLMLWCCIIYKRRPLFLWFFLLSGTFLMALRPIPLVVFCLALSPFLLMFVMGKVVEIRRKSAVIFWLLFCLASVFTAYFLRSLYFETLSMIFYNSKHVFSLEWLYRMREYRVEFADSAFLAGWDFTNLWGLLKFLPLTLLHSFFAPFPWQWGSPTQIMALCEMLIFYLFLPFIYWGWKAVYRSRSRAGLVMLVYIGIMFLVLVFLEGNVGTLFRHRAMVLPFLFVLAGIGIDRKLTQTHYYE